MKHFMFSDQKNRRRVVFESILFVDPGFGGTGWAQFVGLDTASAPSTSCHPTTSGVLRFKGDKPTEGEGVGSWVSAASKISAAFAGLLTATMPRHVVLETPTLWSGSAVSHASATGKGGETGDLFKLAYLVGQLGYLSEQITGNLPILVMPHEWKGQLPKELVLKRLAAFGITARDHEGDAIGMGFAAQGLL
jgi:hypothetical protein